MPNSASTFGEVDAAVVAVGGFEVARRVVARARPGERVQEVEAPLVAALDLHLQRAIVAPAAVEGRLDELVALDRTARLQRRVLAVRVRPRLVQVAEDHQVLALVADVADVDDEVGAELALHGDVPVLDLAGLEVGRDVVDAAVERVEVRRHVQAFRIAHLRRAEAGGRRLRRRAQPLRRLLRDRDRHDVRTVERQQVLAAEPVEQHVADAVGRAQHGLVVDAVGHAEARRRSCSCRG